MKGIAIIILNYNSAFEVIRQIKQIGIAYYDQFFIIDNNSQDADLLKKFCAENKIFFKNMNSNNGYAYANNFAIRKAIDLGFQYFMILNPDVHISQNTILSLKLKLERNESLIVVGPRLCYENNKDIIFSDGGLLFPEKGFEGNHVNYLRNVHEVINMPEINTNIDYVNGSAMMFKASILDEIGFMYEDLFLYYEESEWCYRTVRFTKNKIGVLTSVIAYQSDSTRGSIYEYYMTRNRTWLCKKYKGNLKYLMYERFKFIKKKWRDKSLTKSYKVEIVKAVISGFWTGMWLRVKK